MDTLGYEYKLEGQSQSATRGASVEGEGPVADVFGNGEVLGIAVVFAFHRTADGGFALRLAAFVDEEDTASDEARAEDGARDAGYFEDFGDGIGSLVEFGVGFKPLLGCS